MVLNVLDNQNKSLYGIVKTLQAPSFTHHYCVSMQFECVFRTGGTDKRKLHFLNFVDITRFRIQHYKRIIDTDWIDVGKVTAMVGKNEVGKSSIFRALSKLNPSDQEGFNKQSELPHKSYVSLKDKNVYPVTVEFKISANEEFLTRTKKEHILIAKKNYDNKFYFEVDGREIKDDKKHKKIIQLLPTFIYFDNYDKIKGRFNIPRFISAYKNNPSDRKIRAEKCMFEYVGLDPETLESLRTNAEMSESEKFDRVEERKILCDSAAAKMTTEFRNWWKVRDYKFDYRMDDDSFGVYVSDHIDTTSVELDQRSNGLQYFFSFFLIFTVESERSHTNSILLLDEPGLHYHATFQLELIEFFKEMSKTNQLLYSTHSPFLVDESNLDDVKIVYEDTDAEKIIVSSDGRWPKDAEVLFPLRLSWWNSVYHAYIVDKVHMLVEGVTDAQIFKEINKIMVNNGKEILDPNLVIISGGGNKMGSLISILMASQVAQFYFLDGDQSGRDSAKRYKKNFNLSGFTTKDFSGLDNSSLEDLIPREAYLIAVKSAYNLSDINLEENGVMVTQQVDTYLKDKNFDGIDKLKITKKLLPLLHDHPENICNTFEPIFKKINDMVNSYGSV